MRVQHGIGYQLTNLTQAFDIKTQYRYTTILSTTLRYRDVENRVNLRILHQKGSLSAHLSLLL